MTRDRAVAARQAHNLEVGGANPPPATKHSLQALGVSRHPIIFKQAGSSIFHPDIHREKNRDKSPSSNQPSLGAKRKAKVVRRNFSEGGQKIKINFILRSKLRLAKPKHGV